MAEHPKMRIALFSVLLIILAAMPVAAQNQCATCINEANTGTGSSQVGQFTIEIFAGLTGGHIRITHDIAMADVVAVQLREGTFANPGNSLINFDHTTCPIEYDLSQQQVQQLIAAGDTHAVIKTADFLNGEISTVDTSACNDPNTIACGNNDSCPGFSTNEGEGSTEGEGSAPTEGEGTSGEGEGSAPVEGEGQVEGEGAPETMHSADTDGNNQIDLSELIRVIQLFNAGAYHCDNQNNDGYAPGTGDENCEPHSADLNGDFVISLSELLRVIQIYNAGPYTSCPGQSEDDFCL